MACFRLEVNGVSLITDPYTPERAGLDPVTDSSDFVVMSSALDNAHSRWQMIPGEPRVNGILALLVTAGLNDNQIAAVTGPRPP